ncbi:MAG TPA: hypothetical protein VFR14_02280 [Candidatus Limnocylindrales bacterium]|nr:hypothetical protein [Candidatus Limnocylindrales bacterium]
MRLILIAAAAVLAAAACSPQALPPPSVAPADPPPGAARPFPVEVGAAREWLEGHTARCEPTSAATGQVLRCVIDYRDAASDYYAVVDVVSTDGSLVWLLEATVDVSGATDPDLAGFDGFYGDTVLGIVASPEPRAVTSWLREHVTTSGSIDADGLMLDMRASPTRTTLRIWQEP